MNIRCITGTYQLKSEYDTPSHHSKDRRHGSSLVTHQRLCTHPIHGQTELLMIIDYPFVVIRAVFVALISDKQCLAAR